MYHLKKNLIDQNFRFIIYMIYYVIHTRMYDVFKVYLIANAIQLVAKL